MTKQECIEKLKQVHFGYYVQTSFEQLYNITMEFNPRLNFMFEDIFSEQSALGYIRGFTDMYDLCECVRDIDDHRGLYRLNGDDHMESVTPEVLKELRDWIIQTIEENYPEPEEPTTEDNSDVVWVEEDDDFLTKRRTE